MYFHYGRPVAKTAIERCHFNLSKAENHAQENRYPAERALVVYGLSHYVSLRFNRRTT